MGGCPTCGATGEDLAAYTGRRHWRVVEDVSRPRECPVCKTVSPPGTARCECGYSFARAAAGGGRAIVRGVASRNIFVGAALFAAGAGVTVVTLAVAAEVGGCIVVAWGAVLVGAGMFFRGIGQWSRSSRLPPGE